MSEAPPPDDGLKQTAVGQGNSRPYHQPRQCRNNTGHRLPYESVCFASMDPAKIAEHLAARRAIGECLGCDDFSRYAVECKRPFPVWFATAALIYGHADSCR